MWEEKSWFLAHLCVTMPTSSQFRLPSYLFSQIIFIIKNYFSYMYISIKSTHLSECEKTHLHFLISIFLPFTPFCSCSIFLPDTLGNCQMAINKPDLVVLLAGKNFWGNGEQKKKGQAPRALISVRMPCAVQCLH